MVKAWEHLRGQFGRGPSSAETWRKKHPVSDPTWNSRPASTFAFLANPATHELREPIIRIDTHGAAVFLAGKNVYKVKRAVRFPFMNFSTLHKRRRRLAY
jgi:hypothetical protein